MDATIEDTKPLRRVGRPKKVAETSEVVGEVSLSDVAQAYAERVWSGQSPDVPPAERLSRVRAALAGQGLACDGVTLEGHSL